MSSNNQKVEEDVVKIVTACKALGFSKDFIDMVVAGYLAEAYKVWEKVEKS